MLVQRIVAQAQLRQRWPEVKIVLRGDSSFCREELMTWCEQPENHVDNLFGLVQNLRLRVLIDAKMENRIKEQMCLFAHRLSTEEMKGNQLRLYFSALGVLRKLGLQGTEWTETQVDTIRLKLLKIAAKIKLSVY
jgi:hypothetical protein